MGDFLLAEFCIRDRFCIHTNMTYCMYAYYVEPSHELKCFLIMLFCVLDNNEVLHVAVGKAEVMKLI